MGQVSPIENNLPGFSHFLTSSTSRLLRYPFMCSWASLVAQLVKNPPARWETWVQSLGREDPLEKEMATHSSILGLPWWLRW